MAVCRAFPGYQPYIVDAQPGPVPPDRHIVLQDGMSVLFMATRSTLEVESVRERIRFSPRSLWDLGQVCGLPTLECRPLFGSYCLPSAAGGVGPGGGAGRSKLEGTQEGRRARGSRDRGPVSGMGVWPRATGRRAHTQPERTDKASGKLEKTFPFFPPDFLW